MGGVLSKSLVLFRRQYVRQPLTYQHGTHSAVPGWVAKQHSCLPGNGVRLDQALSERMLGMATASLHYVSYKLSLPLSFLLDSIFSIEK